MQQCKLICQLNCYREYMCPYIKRMNQGKRDYCNMSGFVIHCNWSNRVTGCADLILKRMGVMPMKNHFDFMDIMTFGLFILALLTFIFMFCK